MLTAVTAFQKSLAASPDYAPVWAALSRVYADQADYGYINAIEGMALARAAVERALSLDPQSAAAWASLGYIRWGYDWNWEGAEEALTEVKLETVEAWRVYGLTIAHQTLDRRDDADAMLEVFIQQYAQVAAYQVAQIYAFRNEPDLAFEWLARGYEQRDVGMTGMICDDLLTNLHEDPRWKPLLIKMKLLKYWKNIE